MNIAERLQKFQDRGFTRDTGAALVLIEEALHAIFTSFPQAFILFGGVTLVLFYESSRHSGDIDLLPNRDEVPSPQEIMDAIRPALEETAQLLGLSPLATRFLGKLGNVEKIEVTDKRARLLFTVDISRASAVIRNELVERPILTDEARVRFPTRNLMLLHKAEAFLGRPAVKCRDAFDIKVLTDSGAKLGDNLKSHLEDGPVSERLEEAEFLRRRIEAVTAQRCEAELRSYLPEAVFQELARNDFEPLRAALWDLFSPWLDA